MKIPTLAAVGDGVRGKRWQSLVSYDNLGKLMLIGLPLMAIVGAIGLALVRQYGFLTLAAYAIVPMILAPAIFAVYNRRSLTAKPLGDRSFKVLMIMYLLLFGYSALLLYANEVRPILYYVIIAAIATIVLLQIVMFGRDRLRTGIILAQIAALALNIIWGTSLKYYYFIGRTDIMGHAWMVENVLAFGHVTKAFDVYQAFPLWHIFNAAVYMISGTDIQVYTLMFLVCGLVYGLSIYATYLAGTKLSGSAIIGMVAALFTSFYPFFILQGTEAMARSITGCLMIVLVYLFTSAKDRRYYFLILLLTLGVIIFHTVSIGFFLAILLLLYIAKKVFMSRDAFPMLDLKYFIIAGAMAAAYWLLTANILLGLLQYNLKSSAPSGIITHSVMETPLNEVFNYMQYMPLMLFIVLGIIVALRSEKMRPAIRAFMVATLLLIPLTFPGPLMLLNKINFNLGMDRFYENGYIFMCLAAAVGFVVVYFRAGRLMKTLMILIFAGLVVLSISNDFVATDNPLVKRPFFTHYFTEGEVAGMDLTYQLASTPMLSDYTTERYLSFTPKPYLSQLVRVDSTKEQFIQSAPPSLILIRKAELRNRPLDLLCIDDYNGGGYDYYVPINDLTYVNSSSPLWNDLGNHSRVLDSNSIGVYY